ncbi:MAG: class I SAM-dependent methyltransferase [Burkholderiaceae bacterium]|nr:class I SAM-dependent methyltransferase [Burkholderiaceae bacterium]
MNDEETLAKPVAPTAGASAWRNWLASPPGRYVLAWQQARFDAAVSDLFGFHALQLGDAGFDALRDNRMPHRVHACRPEDLAEGAAAELLIEHFEELPIASESLDLVVLPHVLEFAADPHQVLREVDRVLRPEGRVIVSGFNPVSLWGMRQWWTRALAAEVFVPRDGQFIALPRLRDWFKLLSFELDRGRYGCYRPPCRTQKWLDRTRFMEDAGDRWWPICGALYVVSAIKRVRAMRLVGPVRRAALPKRAVPVAIAASREAARRQTIDQRYM